MTVGKQHILEYGTNLKYIDTTTWKVVQNPQQYVCTTGWKPAVDKHKSMYSNNKLTCDFLWVFQSPRSEVFSLKPIIEIIMVLVYDFHVDYKKQKL